MYESLLTLPYFQGMSKDDITRILDKVTFDFANYRCGETVFEEKEECDKFSILIKGKISCVTSSAEDGYTLSESIEAPFAIEPYSLFGGETKYKRSYTAEEDCSILVFDKKFLFSEFTRYDIFTINMLNLISNKTQKSLRLLLERVPTTIEGRIAQFIALRSEECRGKKKLSIKMEQLAALMCETRLNISKALNTLNDMGVVELHRKEIVIPSLRELTEAVK